MDGKEVCEKLRKYEKENGLRRAMILLISGNYEGEDVMQSLGKDSEDKADCFLKKPLVFEEFCWTIYKFRCWDVGRSNTSIAG